MRKKFRSGRVVGLIGLPCSGKTTLVKALIQSSKEIIAHISTGDIARRLSTNAETEHMAEGNLFPLEDLMREEILKLVEKRKGQGSEIVFLDGCPRFDDQVKWMLDNQLAGGPVTDGCLIKIIGEDLLIRAKHRMRDDQDALGQLQLKINKQEKMIDQMEKVIFRYGLPYYTVMNSDLSYAATTLAKIVGLRK